MTTIVVIAKECLPGRVKTRLHPPLSLEQAAVLAAASLDDTLAALATLPATRRILAFDGVIPPAAAAGYEILPQSQGTLDVRLAAVFDACEGPTVLVGMDTPQLTSSLLEPVFTDWTDDVDAWFGFANDGGFWTLALNDPSGDLIRGVPMSRGDTGALQLTRLTDAGLRVSLLPTLTDVDTIDDARSVAEIAPTGRFAAALNAMMAASTKDGLR
ncbi:DUF2064 domain-containing protein [Cryobacterium sp. TMT1-21]|uniref:DUF2064 domain-containing protein n=1 Tax=Cryobacterium shii TaxID=1259235 RepID=A0AAQ2C6L0_9MICO|nr:MULTISPECIES: DUF2064 domain-containing protein [Cryobacterium]TFC48273.1 DUF2064 domain-containing protein [Cryobacterium shii]TFC83796.1 DUF2064 domain-containing protein [Cryobacterium sp. TmT2-59]TFD15457.1 DUF2064 domain-containing protein [Cryobacterium sp. TMT1-21]TFD16650.1 DUF2064 domain-containing protein [Cryobacterium sp. TMT4-10]TFD21891.1 DUF2064 domain-containing protein [Cryobacterium sp. TMT2-23]